MYDIQYKSGLVNPSWKVLLYWLGICLGLGIIILFAGLATVLPIIAIGCLVGVIVIILVLVWGCYDFTYVSRSNNKLVLSYIDNNHQRFIDML